MADESYRKLINESKRKLSELKARRDELDVEMGKLRLLIFATANMLPDDERDEAMEGVDEETFAQRISLTEVIRRALENGADWQSPKQIRDSLENSGYDFTEYGNVMASIHTTLKRLVAAGQAESKNAEKVGFVYKWKGVESPTVKLQYRRRPITPGSLRNLPSLDAPLDPDKLPPNIAALLGRGGKK
jgi:hypothetical protein